MEKIWLKEYPAGVPAEIDLNEFTSLKDILEKSCERFADLPAYSNMGVTLRYRDIDRLSRNFGAWLQARGLNKGDRVAIMMPNALQYPIALFGALRAGMTVVNVNPLYTPRELEHQLIDSGASRISPIPCRKFWQKRRSRPLSPRNWAICSRSSNGCWSILS